MARKTAETKTLPGKLSIARSRGGADRNDRPIHITLEDASSGVIAIEVRMALADFASALTGSGCCDCEYTVYDNRDIFGKKIETKAETIFIPDLPYGNTHLDKRMELIRAAIRPYETEGWQGRDSDGENHHCWTAEPTPGGAKGHMTKISFRRFVEPSG
jgi:hypothetical protein